MMVIKEIKLKNFQGHKETTIELDKGINVLIGSSSAGKTSIMRGVSWITINRPTGNAIISYWNRDKKGAPLGETSVELTSNGNSVKRIKDKDTNGYTLNGRELNCIGLDVPSDVTAILQLDNLNIHKQLDPHFLLSETPGEVARYLNSLIGLSAIDLMLSKADKEIRECNKSISEQEAKLVEQKAIEAKYRWVVEAKKLYQEYQAVEDKADAVANAWATLSVKVQQIEDVTVPPEHKVLLVAANGIINDIDKASNDITSKEVVLAKIADILRTLSLSSIVTARKSLVESAKAIIDDIDAHTRAMIAPKSNIDVLSSHIGVVLNAQTLTHHTREVVEDSMMYFERIDKLAKRIDVTVEESRHIKRLIDTIQLEGIKSADANKELKTVLALMPDTCPLCGGKMKGDNCE